MAKERITRKKATLKPDDFLEPIDITQFGGKDDPCFGKHYNLSAPECKRCGDSGLCGLVFGQNQNVQRQLLEKENRFKDLEKDEVKTTPLDSWVKSKKEEGLKRTEIIKIAKRTYGSTREEIKEIYKRV